MAPLDATTTAFVVRASTTALARALLDEAQGAKGGAP